MPGHGQNLNTDWDLNGNGAPVMGVCSHDWDPGPQSAPTGNNLYVPPLFSRRTVAYAAGFSEAHLARERIVCASNG